MPLSRKGKLLEMSKVRRKALEESLQLQKFLGSSYEVWELDEPALTNSMLVWVYEFGMQD